MPLLSKVGKKQWKIRMILIGITMVLWIGVFLHLFPVWWGIVHSFTSRTEFYQLPPPIFPTHPTFAAYKLIFSAFVAPRTAYEGFTFEPIYVYLKNSLIITGAIMLLQISIASLAAWSLSKLYGPRWSRFLFLFFIGVLLTPWEISLIPKYLLMTNFPWAVAKVPINPFTGKVFPSINFLDSFWAVILPSMFAAFNLLLFKGFFDTIPDEIVNAARLDGASEPSIFLRIVLPVSKPVFAVVAYLTFSSTWNQFMWPLIVLKDVKKLTLPVLLYHLQQLFSLAAQAEMGTGGRAETQRGLWLEIAWNLPLAVGVIQSIPVFIMFIIFREQLMKGIKLRGFK